MVSNISDTWWFGNRIQSLIEEQLMLPNFWRMIWRNADKTVPKCASSALCLRHRNLFSPKLEARKQENGLVNIYCCQFWRMIWWNADKTVSRCAWSALCFRHRNLFWPKLEARKHENGVVNIYCWQNFEEWFDEMLTEPSQSVLRVLCAFGAETTFFRNLKFRSMQMGWSTFIVAKFLKNDLKKSWQNGRKVCFECSMRSAQKPLLAEIGSWLNSSWTLKFSNYTLSSFFLYEKKNELSWQLCTKSDIPQSVERAPIDVILRLSLLPLSNYWYILNNRRYHQSRELRHWANAKEQSDIHTQNWTVQIWFVG